MIEIPFLTRRVHHTEDWWQQVARLVDQLFLKELAGCDYDYVVFQAIRRCHPYGLRHHEQIQPDDKIWPRLNE